MCQKYLADAEENKFFFLASAQNAQQFVSFTKEEGILHQICNFYTLSPTKEEKCAAQGMFEQFVRQFSSSISLVCHAVELLYEAWMDENERIYEDFF